jgi:hypothetical protein
MKIPSGVGSLRADSIGLGQWHIPHPSGEKIPSTRSLTLSNTMLQDGDLASTDAAAEAMPSTIPFEYSKNGHDPSQA